MLWASQWNHSATPSLREIRCNRRSKVWQLRIKPITACCVKQQLLHFFVTTKPLAFARLLRQCALPSSSSSVASRKCCAKILKQMCWYGYELRHCRLHLAFFLTSVISLSWATYLDRLATAQYTASFIWWNKRVMAITIAIANHNKALSNSPHHTTINQLLRSYSATPKNRQDTKTRSLRLSKCYCPWSTANLLSCGYSLYPIYGALSSRKARLPRLL